MPLHKQLTQNVQDEKKSKFEIRSKIDFFLMKKGIHIIHSKTNKTGKCHRTTFYSILNMIS